MNLALIFRNVCTYTTGVYYQRALDYLAAPYYYINNNDILNGRASLKDFDAALVIDDGFGIQVLPNLPTNSSYIGIDLHNWTAAGNEYKPEALHQYKFLYTAQYTYGVKLLESRGYKAEWLPLAWDSVGCTYQTLERDIPISFIGSYSTEARWFLQDIVRHKYDGYADNDTFHAEMGEVYSRSKLGLGMLGGLGHQTYFNHINGRVFEMMGCGALLLQQELYNPFTKESLDDFGRLGLVGAQGWMRSAQHTWVRPDPPRNAMYVFWRDASQLYETIEQYLSPRYEAERLEIAARGQTEVRNQHTFIHRAERILDDLEIT